MPVTPFHFGAGLAGKAALPRRFGLLAFCAANIIIDVEPLYYALTGQYPLHRFLHTLPGALVASLLTVVLFWLMRSAWTWLRLSQDLIRLELHPSAVWLGALSGAFSHVLFDSVVHGDVHPFSPLSQLNPFLDWFTIGQVQGFLTLLGFFGIAGWVFRTFLRPSRKSAFEPFDKNP
ncbi:predicted membrane-bound metal-dependent hydrolase [Bellilinea caldifistulae]|uniref:hypothetical protein n=1 Tax=Bellilinea caldifistulae TaxID=360411 RepID=UPI0007837EDC|nr:hypothetical protein [Bellilinea caldifistulae]GAP11920.1 predicted membrane-bound metal-dependent hydrolase [Bellilinea caldifistulae]